MQRIRRLMLGILASSNLMVACASTQVVDHEPYEGPRLERPERIVVYDFAATREDLPRWSEACSRLQAGPAMREDVLEAGRVLGQQVAESLVSEIDAMGLNAVRATEGGEPVDGDLVLVGCFSTFDEGSRMERVVIGFGSGSAELQTHVEVYERTDGEFRRLAAGGLRDGGSAKGPGVVVPLVVTLATANPIGLVVGGAVKATGEMTGQTTIEAAGKRAAERIGEALEAGFRRQGWL